MADVKNVGATPLPIDNNAAKIADEAAGKLPNQPLPPDAQTVGRGAVGQPVGQPAVEPTTQNALMSNVVTGRDHSQMIAAEKMRSNGGHSATDVLLGLNRQPSMLGVLLAPPGNLEILRHLSPAARRKVLRNLLSKQRSQMRGLVEALRGGDDERGERQSADDDRFERETETDAAEILLPSSSLDVASKFYNRRAVRDLEATTKMLDLLDELLGMQDYTLSQMGTFAQG